MTKIVGGVDVKGCAEFVGQPAERNAAAAELGWLASDWIVAKGSGGGKFAHVVVTPALCGKRYGSLGMTIHAMM
jgi:hypothetical protein